MANSDTIIVTRRKPIALGTALPWFFRPSALSPSTPVDFSTTPVTIYFDGPARYGSPGKRTFYRWVPGGTSDPHFSLSAGVLYLTFTSVENAAMFYVGNWQMAVLIGSEASQQLAGVVQFTICAVSPVGAYLTTVVSP